MAEDFTGTVNETVILVLEGKYLIKTIPFCDTLETYEETPIYIPINIMEEAVESVAIFVWELWPRSHGLGSNTGMAFEMWGG